MNVIRKLTLSSVRLNKKRSIATVIAIILSTALICGTAGLCVSALYSFAESARYQMGDFHVTVNDVSREETAKITQNANVKSTFFTYSLGYAILPGGRNEEKPYVFIYAVEHSPENGEIDITAENSGLFVSIRITDHGEGIDEADLPHIFERFYKAKNAGPDSFGVGLSLAKTVIERVNGTLRAVSKKGEGSTFTAAYRLV